MHSEWLLSLQLLIKALHCCNGTLPHTGSLKYLPYLDLNW